MRKRSARLALVAVPVLVATMAAPMAANATPGSGSMSTILHTRKKPTWITEGHRRPLDDGHRQCSRVPRTQGRHGRAGALRNRRLYAPVARRTFAARRPSTTTASARRVVR